MRSAGSTSALSACWPARPVPRASGSWSTACRRRRSRLIPATTQPPSCLLPRSLAASPPGLQPPTTSRRPSQPNTFVLGDFVEFDFAEPRATGANYTAGVERLTAHRIAWEWVAAAGSTLPATWALLDTAVRDLEATGRYVFAIVQAAGPDLITGASAAVTTASWVSTAIGGYTGAPTYEASPRLQIALPWLEMKDPVTDRDKIWPMTYAYCGHLARRQPWQPPDAVRYGALRGVESIYPIDLSGENIDSLDDEFYLTAQYHPGREGVYVTHGRMWGQPPAPGVDSTDYTGVERRRVMDEACRRVYRALFPFLNDIVETDANGRMTTAEKAQWGGTALAALRTLQAVGALSAAQAVVNDKDPGILVSGTVLVQIRFVPAGKAESIEATLAFFGGVAQTEEVA